MELEVKPDYETPHGRVHTRAADVAFLLWCREQTEPGTIERILAIPDRTARSAWLQREVLNRAGMDLIRQGNIVMVEVQPEPGQRHLPAYAPVVSGNFVSRCDCPDGTY